MRLGLLPYKVKVWDVWVHTTSASAGMWSSTLLCRLWRLMRSWSYQYMHVQSPLHLMIEVQLILFMVSYCIVVFTYLCETCRNCKIIAFQQSSDNGNKINECHWYMHTHCLVNPVIMFLSLVSNGAVASRSESSNFPVQHICKLFDCTAKSVQGLVLSCIWTICAVH